MRQVYMVVVQQPENITVDEMRMYIEWAVKEWRRNGGANPVHHKPLMDMSDKSFYVKVV